MAPKHASSIAVIGSIVLLAVGAPALASDYRAGELLTLDLSKAVLSPKRIGPPAEFAPVPVQARTDSKQVVAEPKAAGQRTVRATHSPRRALAHRSNPLDAQAMDTRNQKPQIQKPQIQTWPCKSGGICDWKR